MSGYSSRYELVDASSKAKHLCLVKYCRRERAPGRRICYCHHVRAWRIKNPDKSAFQVLKDHAKRRNIKFTLTFQQFLDIAVKTGYIDRKGTFSDDLHLDRIDPLRGYEADNLQVLSCSENARKGATYDKSAYHRSKQNQKVKTYEKEHEDDCPF